MRKIIWPAIIYVHFLLTEYKIEVLLCALQVPGQLVETAGIFRGDRYAMHDRCVFLFIYCLVNRHGRGIIYSCGFCDGRCQRHLEIHQWIFEIKKHQLKIMKHLSIYIQTHSTVKQLSDACEYPFWSTSILRQFQIFPQID